jgi:phospholipid transport system substrate-binding protein
MFHFTGRDGMARRLGSTMSFGVMPGDTLKIRTRRHLTILIATVICLGLVNHGCAGEPLEMIKSSVEKVLAVLKDPKLKSSDKKQERVERLKEIINPIFDYDEMARRALGGHWRRRTPTEQGEYLTLFRLFIERVYADKVDLYEGERIVVGRETIDGDYGEVESKVINARGEESPVFFRLRRADGKWRVYDAVVENISVVQNYRSQFDRVISKSSYDELRKLLKEKVGPNELIPSRRS